MLEIAPLLTREALDDKLQRGMFKVIQYENVLAIAAFVRKIVAIPPEVLDSQRKLKVLLGTRPRKHKPVAHEGRIQRGPAMPFVPALASFSHDGREGPARSATAPLLSRICDGIISLPPGFPAPIRIYWAMGVFLNEVANAGLSGEESEGFLCVEDKEAVAASMYEGFTVAQVAMQSGHAGAAGAMLIGILESYASVHDKHRMLAALGVDASVVLNALTDSPQEPDFVPMAERIRHGQRALALMSAGALIELSDWTACCGLSARKRNYEPSVWCHPKRRTGCCVRPAGKFHSIRISLMR